MNQHDLLKGLLQLNGSIEELFNQIPREQLQWRPRENMRTILELANHLAQVPTIDLEILRGAPEAQVREVEARLQQAEPGGMFGVWASGVQSVSEFYTGLSPEQFESQVGKAFYGHEAPLQDWLLEIITHGYHHRAQLFTYLKQIGRPVDMFTLYL